MISIIKCGKILLAELFILILAASCSGGKPSDRINSSSEKSFKSIKMRSYKGSVLNFSLFSDSGKSVPSGEDFILYNPFYVREEGESVTVSSDSCLSGRDVITYYSNVTVNFKDSMVLYTDSMTYFVDADSAVAEDSVLIQKEKNRMVTKKFIGKDGFKRIEFPNRVMLYGE